MFDKLCEKLFGTRKENQEKELIKLLIISVALFIVAIGMKIDGAIILPLLVWGWRAMCACVGITQIGQFFQYNILIIIVSVIAWLFLGSFVGMIVLPIGIIRLVQLEIEKRKKNKRNEPDK